jgi:hypothetical protein
MDARKRRRTARLVGVVLLLPTLAGLAVACGGPDTNAQAPSAASATTVPTGAEAEGALALRTLERADRTEFGERALTPNEQGMVTLADLQARVIPRDEWDTDPVWRENDRRLREIGNAVFSALRHNDLEPIRFLSRIRAAEIEETAQRYGESTEGIPDDIEAQVRSWFEANFQRIRERAEWGTLRVARIETEVLRKANRGKVVYGSAHLFLVPADADAPAAPTLRLTVDDLLLTVAGYRATDRSWLILRETG